MTTTYRAIIRLDTGVHYTDVVPLNELFGSITLLARQLFENNELNKREHKHLVANYKDSVNGIKDLIEFDKETRFAEFKSTEPTLSLWQKRVIRNNERTRLTPEENAQRKRDRAKRTRETNRAKVNEYQRLYLIKRNAKLKELSETAQ